MTTEKFKTLICQYEKLVFTICYQMVRDYQEAENLTQETFVSAFTHIDSCREDTMKAWLARIATNKAKDHLKSAYNRKVALSQDMSEMDVIRQENSPEQLYMGEEGAQRIKEKILTLKEPYSKVSIMFFLEEKSIDAISAALGRPKKTVQTQIYRARSMLQQMIKEDT
ncbi:RNA polymerase sigma factor [Youxingia wuxianensis]|uniref:Sigma-70 family RNA polymerase sigma factor n=1 Tax=Youxingia wuxianensis TaxID=2763678 RepID=A0A926ELZ7_9FIRM|nr:sigma-70 family RNA polymerase sigma factor [Youxingia wuxianensis]MBC8584151.1 sigma-70 family RNA polymerase sigma factor [Youxingia wuxianensis]